MIQKLRRLTATDIDGVNRFIIDVCEAFNRLVIDPLFNRRRLVASLSATQTTIAHNLGKPPQSILVVQANAPAMVWSSTPADERYIYMSASNSVNVTLEVY
jgi:hypothetical protein